MTGPTHRVLATLELLQGTGVIGGAELARSLGVDRRTVRRYVAHLIELGIPVQAVRGRDGGYQLTAGYRLPPMMFSSDEALALALGLRVAGALGLAGVTPAIASTQAKLARVLPEDLRRRLADIDQTVALDLARPHAGSANAALLALSAAARSQQTVCLRYGSASGQDTVRELDVYGLAYRAGAWYAAGHCHLRGALRLFRLDRVQAVTPVPRSFGRPADFDVMAFLVRSIATLPRTHAVDVWLHTDLATAARAVPVELGELSPARQGVRLRAQADDLDWMARELARLPFGFRITKPKALRVALATHAQQLARQAVC